MELNLAGKTALITGASQGIGCAIAKVLAAEGCHFHLAARNGAAMEELKKALAQYPVSVTVHEADLGTTEAMVALDQACGDYDILMNNAGDIPAGTIEDVTDAAIRHGFDLKVFGYITLARQFWNRRKGKGGVIINVIGNSGENWDAAYFAGSTGNAALMSFTKAIGGRSMDEGIRVVGVNPGPVDTPRMFKIMKRKAIDMLGDESRWEELYAKYPGKRPATAEEVADLCAFLASPKAGYISGTVVTIDGGIAARGSGDLIAMTDARTRNRYFDDLFSTPDLAWMGQNTNHVPAHPAVTEAMIRSVAAGEFNAYAPPMGFEALRSAIVADLGAGSAEALVTEGGVNALAMICKARAKPGTTLVTTDPTWKWPCMFAEQAGAEIIQIPIYDPAVNYKLTPDALRAAVDERCAIIYIVDPNNPLGIRYDRGEIEAFAEIARSVGALMVHDCTYRDFADGHTPVQVAPEGTVVSLSFSKWLGLAGMRIGALVAEPKLVDEFSAASSSVLGASVVAQRAAMAGLSVKTEWMQDVRRFDRANKAMIVEAATAAGLHVPIPVSHGNFLVLETASTGVSPEAIVEAARREGVMIRQGRYHTAAFGDRFIKVSTSVPTAWAERFCEGLPRYIETARTLNDVPALF